MPFLSELVVQEAGDNDWKLTAPLRYAAARQCFEIPPGAVTDFASIPVVFQWLLPRSGRYTKAAVLHDHLWRTPVIGVSMGDADGIFRRCMRELGVPFLRRWLMWAAVRLNSLWKSRLRDRPGDLPRVLAVLVFPGLYVIAAGVVVGALLLGYAALEIVLAVIVLAARLVPAMRRRLHPPRLPAPAGRRG